MKQIGSDIRRRQPYMIAPMTKQTVREMKAHIEANELTLKWLQSFKPTETIESTCKGFLGYRHTQRAGLKHKWPSATFQ